MLSDKLLIKRIKAKNNQLLINFIKLNLNELNLKKSE